jgi:ferredoxin
MDFGVGTTPVTPSDELGTLKAQAKAMEEQLKTVNESIAGFQAGVPVSSLMAVVDTQKCVACGVCVEACPVGAIGVNEVAQVDGEKCTGCGRCVTDCPQGALSLHKRPFPDCDP